MTDKDKANEALVLFAQRRLRDLGLYSGRVDGWGGPATQAALQIALEMPVTAPPQALIEELPWMQQARAVVGLHEVRDNAKLSAWLTSGGKHLGDPSNLPWCGDFVETAFAKSMPDEQIPDKPFWARSWVQFGKKVDPTYGAVLVFERGSQSGHVGFAIGQDQGDFYVLGGNQGDAVSVVAIAKHRLLSARWPLGLAIPKINLPRMTLAVARSHNEA